LFIKLKNNAGSINFR